MYLLLQCFQLHYYSYYNLQFKTHKIVYKLNILLVFLLTIIFNYGLFSDTQLCVWLKISPVNVKSVLVRICICKAQIRISDLLLLLCYAFLAMMFLLSVVSEFSWMLIRHTVKLINY